MTGALAERATKWLKVEFDNPVEENADLTASLTALLTAVRDEALDEAAQATDDDGYIHADEIRALKSEGK